MNVVPVRHREEGMGRNVLGDDEPGPPPLVGQVIKVAEVVVREVANFAALLIRGPDGHTEKRKGERKPVTKTAPTYEKSADEKRKERLDALTRQRVAETKAHHAKRARKSQARDR